MLRNGDCVINKLLQEIVWLPVYICNKQRKKYSINPRGEHGYGIHTRVIHKARNTRVCILLIAMLKMSFDWFVKSKLLQGSIKSCIAIIPVLS